MFNDVSSAPTENGAPLIKLFHLIGPLRIPRHVQRRIVRTYRERRATDQTQDRVHLPATQDCGPNSSAAHPMLALSEWQFPDAGKRKIVRAVETSHRSV